MRKLKRGAAPWRAGVLVLAGAMLATAACTTTVEGNLGPQKGTKEERVEAHLALARGYLDRARGPLESALKVDPTSAEAHVLLAILYQAQGEVELVEREYELALRYSPDNAQALNNYGAFLYSQGRYEEARRRLERAVADVNYVRRAQAYENLGLVLLRLDDAAGAELAFQRSLRLNAGGATANFELADIYFVAGDYPAAARYYTAFAQLKQQTPRTLWLGVQLARVFNDKDTEASYALMLRNLYPGSEEFRLYRDSLK